MGRWVFDIEGNGLLNEVTKIWCVVGYNIDTKKFSIWEYGDSGWRDTFNEATLLVGHNIIGYDLPVFEKIYGWKIPKNCKINDTLLMSQIQDYKRFYNGRHRLEDWGDFLEYPKIEFNDFSQYSDKMLEYCMNDVGLNVRVYKYLLDELAIKSKRAPLLRKYIKAEHEVAKWSVQAQIHGWPFNIEGARKLDIELTKELDKAYSALSHKLGYKCTAVDKKNGVVEPKKPKWTKVGFYDAFTAKWFDIDPCSGYEGEERPILGPYSRVKFEKLSLDSVTDVKIFLFRNGWQPNEYNYKKDKKGRKIRKSPKITEDSLEFLGGDGKLYKEFLTVKARHGILKTWIDNTDENGMLHGDSMTIGTPSMRMRHKIIVNVPAGNSLWGKEMRELFQTKPGWKLIGCDSSGNQARGLAHYLKDEEFINTLLHGDIHQYNADILTSIVKSLGFNQVVLREQSKRIYYAFLFGASGEKLWSYIFGYPDLENGNKLKNMFIKAVPGFENLTKSLKRIYSSTKKFGDGYIPSLAGNRIYVDSYHKLLVYLLQSAEKITCSAALMLTVERLNENKIPYIPCIMMHDEIDFMVPEKYAENAARIGQQAFIDGPKLFGVEIMDGEGKIGNNWYEIH